MSEGKFLVRFRVRRFTDASSYFWASVPREDLAKRSSQFGNEKPSSLSEKPACRPEDLKFLDSFLMTGNPSVSLIMDDQPEAVVFGVRKEHVSAADMIPLARIVNRDERSPKSSIQATRLEHDGTVVQETWEDGRKGSPLTWEPPKPAPVEVPRGPREEVDRFPRRAAPIASVTARESKRLEF